MVLSLVPCTPSGLSECGSRAECGSERCSRFDCNRVSVMGFVNFAAEKTDIRFLSKGIDKIGCTIQHIMPTRALSYIVLRESGMMIGLSDFSFAHINTAVSKIASGTFFHHLHHWNLSRLPSGEQDCRTNDQIGLVMEEQTWPMENVTLA